MKQGLVTLGKIEVDYEQTNSKSLGYVRQDALSVMPKTTARNPLRSQATIRNFKTPLFCFNHNGCLSWFTFLTCFSQQ